MRRRLLFGLPLVLLVLAALCGGLLYQGYQAFETSGPLADDRVVTIPKGSGLGRIAARLETAGVISDGLIFRLGVRYLGAAQSLRAGEYAFAPGISMRGVMTKLSRGETVVHRITIPEGITSREVVALLEADEVLGGAIEDPPGEGEVLPETYHYSRGDSRQDLLGRMIQAQIAAVELLWEERDSGLPLASPSEALVLASIVEKETALAEERPLVAGVFINRLNQGMRLQSDPTVVYGLTSGERPLGRALTRKDLKAPSPYNTYVIDGLPPGPIANVGRAALRAVLNPAKTEYLYFVADGSGGHAFSRTLAEHNRNVAKWRKIRKKKRAAGD